MKIALLIGVSEYNTQKALPGCKNDVLAMEQIIDSTNNYDDKLVIYSDTNSNNIKKQVSDFFDEHRNSEEKVQEVFFYFSGHGLYQEEEFYYILSDYDNKRLNRTTYKNSEIDALIKSLNPELTIKVVDACESGVRYVKDIGKHEVRKMLDKTTDNFCDCYFMFSSQFNESSYALDTLSYFTESFINSILSYEDDTIRYRDIIDFIADDFSNKSLHQTPFYITQGTNTEVFGHFSIDTKEKLKKEINFKKIEEVLIKHKELSLIDRVIEDSKYYCENVEDIKVVFNDIKTQINETKILEELSKIYNIETNFENIHYNSLKKINKVAEFISEDNEDFFVQIKYAWKKFKVRINDLSSQISRSFGHYKEFQYREEKRKVIDSYEITEDSLPYNIIEIDLNPIYSNLIKYNCSLIFAFSKKELLIFYSYNLYREVKWGEFEIKQMDWRRGSKVLFKENNDIKSQIDDILNGFNEFVTNNLKKHFNTSNDDTGSIVTID
ncbi:caspase domain-containing protein [Paenibacillus sp. WLX2291]|uniref:caspase family protein n=1 Tax=Paenibacillus sp. WLX2291 TaxID=3296934 RepID=UPI00398452A3